MLQDTVDILRAVGAALFLAEFIAYAVIGYIKFDTRYRALGEIIYDNLLVTGLGAMLYAYIADGGALQWSWLIYSFSCVNLAISFYRVLTYDRAAETKQTAPDREHERSYEYMFMKVGVFLTLISGLAIELVATSTWRWAIFIAGFVFFLFAALAFFRAVNMRINNREAPSKYWIRVVCYVTMAFWLGYPIVMVLGPLFVGAISLAGVSLGYVLLDLVTKHLFMALTVYYMYVEAPADAPRRQRGSNRYSVV